MDVGKSKFIEHFNRLTGIEPLIFKHESLIEDLPDTYSLVYKNIPEPGYIFAVSYGLSDYNAKEWVYSRPEFCICVESEDILWGDVVGYLANNMRGNALCRYGQIINFGSPISDESEMSSFLIFGPSIFEKEDYQYFDIGLDYKITLAGLYPIYDEEVKVYHEIGLEGLWNHPNFDLYKINREKIINTPN